MDWLDANEDQRAFLFLHFNDPHEPYTQPKPYRARFGADPADFGLDPAVVDVAFGAYRAHFLEGR